jgi:hypothetical protein
MDKLNCLCASENQVVDESDVIFASSQTFMASYDFDDFEQEDEFDSILCKDTNTFLTRNSSSTITISYQSEPDDDLPRGCKRVNSMDSHASFADTCTTVSLSQSLMHDDDDEDDDEDEDDEVYSTVTTEGVKNLQIPFRSKGSNHEHESFRYLKRMTPDNYNHEHESFQYLQRLKPDNYIRDDDGDGNLSVGKKSCLRPFFFSQVPLTNIQVALTA